MTFTRHKRPEGCHVHNRGQECAKVGEVVFGRDMFFPRSRLMANNESLGRDDWLIFTRRAATKRRQAPS